MEYKFDDLEIGAKPVIHYFEEISAIPHGSGNTKGISDYLAGFAKSMAFGIFRTEQAM